MASNSNSSNTTFVEADPSNFRAVVQRLTGSSAASTAAEVGGFKLHERRQVAAMSSMRKLEMIKLNNYIGLSSGLAMASLVSTLDGLGLGLSSPRTPTVSEEEERAIIAEKGFYLHPVSPLSTPRDCEPQLLPLFPLHSPRDLHKP